MRAMIKKLNPTLHYCEAIGENYELVVFRPPSTGLNLGDSIELDETLVDQPQTAINLTTGATFTLELWRHNIHALRSPVEPALTAPPATEQLVQ